MSIEISEKYQVVVLSIKGRFLGSINGPEFKDILDKLTGAGKVNIVIDLSETDFMDSSGIGTLIGSLTTVRRQGGEIRLANMHKRVKNLFLMTRLLGSAFKHYETVDEASQSFVDDPPPPAAEGLEQ